MHRLHSDNVRCNSVNITCYDEMKYCLKGWEFCGTWGNAVRGMSL